MCGLTGCISNGNVCKIILESLKMLKGRGYDSTGIYFKNSNLEYLVKYGIDSVSGNIFSLLEDSIKNSYGNIGIGHTRWATHGAKTNSNAHPHMSNNGNITIVHNGIISNYLELKNKYLSEYNFHSTTDSEVIANLLEHFMKSFTIDESLKLLSESMVGTWSIIISISDSDSLYFLKNKSPLLIGFNKDLAIITSEESGLLSLVNQYYTFDDMTYGFITQTEIILYKGNSELNYPSDDFYNELPLDTSSNMYKEICDQQNLIIYNSDIKIDFNNFSKLIILGCGSSYNAGLIGGHYIRNLKVFNTVEIIEASLFNDSYLVDTEKLCIVVISQSGETRDLDNAISNIKNIPIIGIINVQNSLIAKKCQHVIYTKCGKEYAVASTKSTTAQIIALMKIGEIKKYGCYSEKFLKYLSLFKEQVKHIINDGSDSFDITARKILDSNGSLFILGTDNLYYTALEGALKIKEIGYIHAEGYPMSALKHGTYALITRETNIIMLYQSETHYTKSIKEELLLRGANIISVNVPHNEIFYPLLSIIALQLISYNIAILKNINPDMPRNLAKVVTTD